METRTYTAARTTETVPNDGTAMTKYIDHKPKPYQRGATIGRNDRCPCNSGKKFKKCHGARA